MATIHLTVSDARVVALDAAKFETLRATMLDVMTTANVTAKTVQTAVAKLPAGFVESLSANGESSDKIAVYADNVIKARYTRENLVNRLRVALAANTITGEIFTDKKGESEKKAVEQEFTAF